MPNTLPYGYTEQVNESAKETYTVLTGGQKAKRVFRGPWADRNNFITSLLPGVSEAEGEITFSDPGIYPDIPTLMAVSAEVEGRGKADCEGVDGMVQYEWALVTVDYEYFTGAQGLPGQTIFPYPKYIDVSGDISTQIFTYQKEEIVIAGGAIPVLKEHKKYITVSNFTIKVLLHPKPKWNEAFSFAGKINLNDIIIPKLNFTATPDTLLYHGVAFVEKAFLNGITIYELDYKFSYRKVPTWNQTYDSNGDIQEGNHLNAGLLYDRVDLYLLFNTAV